MIKTQIFKNHFDEKNQYNCERFQNDIKDKVINYQINNNNEFIYKAETSNLSMGKSFQNKEDPKWILIDFDNI